MATPTSGDESGKSESDAASPHCQSPLHTMTMLFGILLGFATAFSQCFAYIFSRLFVIRHRNAFWKLLLVSHLYIGLASLLGLFFIWPEVLPPPNQYVGPLLGTAGFYIIGQCGLFMLMRMTSPSRVAPLLGAKIIILALLATFVFGQSLPPMQWLAVLACFGAVLIMNFSGESLPAKTVMLLLLTCTGYSLSDLNIDRLVRALSTIPTLHAAVWGALMAYVLLGVLAAIIVLIARPKALWADWRLSLPFAALWMTAMLTLFACIGLVGPVFAVILQSTRGLMSVVLGALIARHGWLTVEQHISRRMLLQRLAAAALMGVAVTLYALAAR
jgi:drug/metabolite transporter (DMT)-like permease